MYDISLYIDYRELNALKIYIIHIHVQLYIVEIIYVFAIKIHLLAATPI